MFKRNRKNGGNFEKEFLAAKPVILVKPNVDHVLAVDASGSMGEGDAPGRQTRWNYSAQRAGELARQAEQFDRDGIDLVIFNQEPDGHKSKTSAAIQDLLRQRGPGGGTATHRAIEWAYELYLDKKAKNPGYDKKLRITVITDGETDQQALEDIIVHIANKVGEQVGVQEKEEDYPVLINILTVGNERRIPIAFLQRLDSGLRGRTPHDIVVMGRLENASITGA